jgi:hypothetical protein
MGKFNMFRNGRRCFSIAAMLMILTAAAHTAGNLSKFPERDTVLAINDEVRVGYWALVFAMSVMLAALGGMNLIIAAVADDRVVRIISWANFVWVGAFGLVCLHYWVPPPLVCAGLIEVFVLGAIVF